MPQQQQQSNIASSLGGLIFLGFLAVLYLNKFKAVEPTPDVVPYSSLYDVEVDVDDSTKNVLSSLISTRKAELNGWTLAVDDNVDFSLRGNEITVSNGIRISKTPFKLTVKSLTVEGDSIVVKFGTGLVKVVLR
jgi:hypothetical protein